MQKVRLNFTPQSDWACLREISGREETAVAGTGTVDAIQLVDGVLVAVHNGELEPGRAAQLTAADRDRLLAAIYTAAFGARVAGTLCCRRCGELFDIDFSLEELTAHLWENDREPASKGLDEPLEPLPDGLYALPDGTRFRLPTGEDECAVLGLPPVQARQALLTRCLTDGSTHLEPEDELSQAVQAAMTSLAPTLDLELDAACSECGELQPVHFDIQHYLLTSLLQERSQLAQEIHRLASAYGWSLNEILSLPRSRRRSLVDLIEAERSKA